MKSKKKVEKSKVIPFCPLPKRDLMEWIGESLLSSMVLKAWHKRRGQPTSFCGVQVVGDRINFLPVWDEKVE